MLFKNWAVPSGSTLRLGKLCSSFELHSSACRKSDSEIPDAEAVAKDGQSDKKLVKRYKVNQGGDINTACILGTVIGIKFFPLPSKPERDWAALFIRTRSMRKSQLYSDESASHKPVVNLIDAMETDNTSPYIQPYSSTSVRVHVFDPRILHNARRALVGDRLFVSGFLSYYKHPAASSTSSADSDSGKSVPKICALVAQRIVFMGSDPSEDAPSDYPRDVELE